MPPPGLDPRDPPPSPSLPAAAGATYDRIAEAYAARAGATPPVLAHLEQFLRRLPDAARVLDAGCGPGLHAALLAGRGLRVVGLDASPQMLRLAGRHVPVVRADLRALPVRPGSLGGLWSAASLLHVARGDVPAALAGWHRALRPGGVLGLSTAVGRAGEQGWEDVSYASDAAPGGPVRRWFVYHPADRLLQMLADAGFAVAESGTRVSHRTWLTVVAVAGTPDG